MAVLIKTVKLSLDTNSVECQLSKMELVDEPTTEEVETFCGKETFATPNYRLNLGGFQDWATVDGVCEIIHTAYTSDPIADINFVATVGTSTRTGTAKPTADVPFGGEAGSALKFEQTLNVNGVPTEGTVP
jgi:hypothetical protein